MEETSTNELTAESIMRKSLVAGLHRPLRLRQTGSKSYFLPLSSAAFSTNQIYLMCSQKKTTQHTHTHTSYCVNQTALQSQHFFPSGCFLHHADGRSSFDVLPLCDLPLYVRQCF